MAAAIIKEKQHMQKYRGLVKFVSNTGRLALVQQFSLGAEKRIVDVVVGVTTSAGDVNVSGDLLVNDGAVIVAGSLDLSLGAAPAIVGADESLATSTGLAEVLASSTGAVVVDGDVTVDGITYDGQAGETGWIDGVNISNDDPSLVDYTTGDIDIVVAAPIGVVGTPVRASFTQAKVDYDAEKVAMLRGDFTGVSVGDTIYYYYSTEVESEIILERSSK
jgi:hypothetical protein